MDIIRTLTAATLAIATVGLAGCSGGVEGTYKLDKAEMKKAMEAQFAVPLPRSLANMATAWIDTEELTMELRAGGELKMTSTMPSQGPGSAAETKHKEGTWNADGASIVFTVDSKQYKCTKSWAKLRCPSEREGAPSLIFVKS